MDETEYNAADYTQTPAACCENLKDYVRENPTRVILAGVGLGLLLAVALRPRKPATKAQRALQILEDIQDHLKEIAQPAYRSAVSAADRGAAAVREGVGHLDDLDLPSTVCSLKRRLLDLFR
ncbi:MAG: hypothetical protein WCD79_10885 [Chthoniobacteraceae bacterium]